MMGAVESNRFEAGFAQYCNGVTGGVIQLEIGGKGVRCALAHHGAGENRHACLGIHLNTFHANRHKGELGGKLTMLREQRDKHLEGAIQNAGVHVQCAELRLDFIRQGYFTNHCIAVNPAPGDSLKGRAIVKANTLSHLQVIFQRVVRGTSRHHRRCAVEQETTAFTHGAGHGI